MLSYVNDMDGPGDEEVAAFQVATRDLVTVALRSLELLDGEVTLPQFRMLIALREHGRCSSSTAAHALHLGASSVTRLGDRLEHSGHVSRGHDPSNRSVVTLELTERGTKLVDEVLSWRHAELTRIMSGLDPTDRAAAAGGLRAFHQMVAASGREPSLPMPL